MATLGGIIPPAIARKMLDRQLSPGRILHLEITFPRTRETKEKLVVLLNAGPEAWFFVINSRPSRLIECNPDLAACQVAIDAASHDSLSYDSHVACEEIIKIPRSSVLDDVLRNRRRLKGRLSEAIVEQVIAATKRAPTLSLREQETIIAELGE